MSQLASVHSNPLAQQYTLPLPPDTRQCRKLHQQLPNFSTTPLRSLPKFAATHGVRAVLIKEEAIRAGLPAYKILGASWATFRAICDDNNLVGLDSTLEEVACVARQRQYILFAATAGNHGRALARLARIMGISAHIYVDSTVSQNFVRDIRNEGATVTVVDGGYANAVDEAAKDCLSTPHGLQIQDFAFDLYTTIPRWHVEGYAALFDELEERLRSEDLKLTHVVVPVGGGTLCHATVEFSKSKGRAISVLAVEPEASPCLQRSLEAGQNLNVPEGATIMGGMISPMVSPISWPVLRQGVDTSVVITDVESTAAADYLHSQSINAGPCGAGSFAGFQNVAEKAPAAFHLTSESVVVVISTDGQSKNQSGS